MKSFSRVDVERNMSIRRTTDICSCNSCHARNYDYSEDGNIVRNADVEKIEDIFELRIGMRCNRLCSGCLKALVKEISDVVGE